MTRVVEAAAEVAEGIMRNYGRTLERKVLKSASLGYWYPKEGTTTRK